LNQRLKFRQTAFRVAACLFFPLLTLIISVLPISCSSRRPEADEPGAEASRSQEEKFPALSDETLGEESDGEGSSGAAHASSAPSELASDDESAGSEAAAVPNQQPEATSSNPLILPEEPAAPSPAFGTADSEVPGSEPEIVEDAPGGEESDGEGSSGAAHASSAPSEFASDDESAGSEATSVSNQQPEATRSNPLILPEESAANSAGTDENVAFSLTNSEIISPAVGTGPEQPDQTDEALKDPAVAAAAPTRFLETPGEFTITLESVGWIFRSDRSTAGSWRFLGREIVGDSTSFRFLFSEIGEWNLVFERQELSSGESEEVVRKVTVDETDGLPSIGNGPIPPAAPNPISGMLPADADARYLAALSAAEAGRIDEAIKYYEQDASRNDPAGARARAVLVETAAKTGAVGPLLTWLPRYLEDSTSPEVLQAALEVFTNEAGYDAQSRAILEKLVESENDYPEWPYRLAVFLEKPGEERDLDRAARLYQEVVTRWPLSEWRDHSEERLLWLQRHYFRVR